MSHIVLSSFVVRNASGSVDFDATVEKFGDTLTTFLSDKETEETSIAFAIESVLDANIGTRTNLDFVTGSVARAMNATALNHTILKNRAAEYIRQNATGEKDGQPVDNKTGEVLAAPRQYFLGKGRDGGVARWTDRMAAKAAKSAE